MGLLTLFRSLFSRRRLDPALDPALLDQPQERRAPSVQDDPHSWQDDPALLDHDTAHHWDDAADWDDAID